MDFSTLTPIKELDASNGKLPDDVLESSTPIKLKGLVAAWPSVKQCQDVETCASYLSKFWSEKRLVVYVGDEDINGRFFYNDAFDGFNFLSGAATLPQVFQKLSQQDRPASEASIYVGSTSVDEWLPGFRTENDLVFDSSDLRVNFWLGTATRVSAHFDLPNNIACVVAGHRRFTLFPPEQVENLYVGPLHPTPSGQAISLVDFHQPDYDRYPRFAQALESAVCAELAPGDALYIPGMWWHHVEALDAWNLLVNYWWLQTPLYMNPTPALWHTMLAIRDLPEAQRRAWAKQFDHYVFKADSDVYEHIPEGGRGWLAPLNKTTAKQLHTDLAKRMKG